MPIDPAELKSMPLYRGVNRIYAELAAAGLDIDETLNASDLAAFDQYHYHGTDAVDIAIASLDIQSDDCVLEIGSGIGGPARHIASITGTKVVALELQPDLDETATDLTHRCGLSEKIEHICADVLEYSPGDRQFDAIVSWLAFFHIEQRQELLTRCKSWLKPTGSLFVEDLFARGDFTPDEEDDLGLILFSRYLPTREIYEADFQDAGFSAIQTKDMSDDWRLFTHERYETFCRNRKRLEDVHDNEIVAGLDSFYGSVARLFRGGHLGGIRLFAKNSAEFS
jgi:cyclopropane fatty-acyl-phospholipid synthase-like methyltransferase